MGAPMAKLHPSLLLPDVQLPPAMAPRPAPERPPYPAQEVSTDSPTMSLYPRINGRNDLLEVPDLSIGECVALIQECAEEKSVHRAIGVHLRACANGLDGHGILGSGLVSMWAEVGSVSDARRCFCKAAAAAASASTSDASLASLAAAYLGYGDLENALCLYRMMREDATCRTRTLIALLKVCSKCGDVGIGYEIHAGIIEEGWFGINPYLGSSLLDMYAKCGLLLNARQVFSLLRVRDVVPWTALISGYVQHDSCAEALTCFERMLSEGISPNEVTFMWILKACANMGDLSKGVEIHDEISQNGLLRRNQILGNALVDMYVKCGDLAKARQVFDDLSARDVVSWTTLISGYVKYEHLSEKALDCFKDMQDKGIEPDAFIYTSILKACTSLKAIEQGKCIHLEVTKKGMLKRNPYLVNALVEMYAKCGSLEKAAEVFHCLPTHDAASWNALIGAYVQHEHATEALCCLVDMQKEGISPDITTYACLLKACGIIGAIGRGNEIHIELYKKGLLSDDLFLSNALIDMYAKCGAITIAQEVFDKLPIHDTVSWNILVSGYVQHELNDKVLTCFEKMQLEGICPDAFSFTCSLKACGHIRALNHGRKIHADIAKKGLLASNVVIGNALLDMYAKCGLLADAKEILKELPTHDVVSWTALISGYLDHKCCSEALDCFEQMRLEGISPNTITFSCALRAFWSTGNIDKGREIHSELISKGLLEEDDIVLDTTLVDMYSKLGFLLDARNVFDRLGSHDVIVCTALISGYATYEQEEEALNEFNRMQIMGLSPSEFTYACILKACGSIGAAEIGRKIHCDIERKGFLDNNLIVGTALVDMYSKCGVLEEAQAIFDKLPVRDLIMWNSLITGYAQLGETETVLGMVERMRADGNEPDAVTFLCIMSSCSHGGFVEEGEIYFKEMRGIIPTLEHYTCMVDLFGRAGQLDRMAAMVGESSFNFNVVMWLAVLAACRRYANIEIGREAFEQITRLDKKGSSAYISMYNIYADADIQDGS